MDSLLSEQHRATLSKNSWSSFLVYNSIAIIDWPLGNPSNSTCLSAITLPTSLLSCNNEKSLCCFAAIKFIYFCFISRLRFMRKKVFYTREPKTQRVGDYETHKSEWFCCSGPPDLYFSSSLSLYTICESEKGHRKRKCGKISNGTCCTVLCGLKIWQQFEKCQKKTHRSGLPSRGVLGGRSRRAGEKEKANEDGNFDFLSFLPSHRFFRMHITGKFP